MAQKGIREFDGKRILFRHMAGAFPGFAGRADQLALVEPDTKKEALLASAPWLKGTKLVVKPDQLFGKRGKHGLVAVNLDFEAAWKWIQERMKKEVTVGKTTGVLTHFLIEPFTRHAEDEEFYVAIKAERDGDVIYLSHKGGIYVEENWDKVKEFRVPILGTIDDAKIVMPEFGAKEKRAVAFVKALYGAFTEGNFTYLEINPFTFDGDDPVPLDLVARVDDQAAFECGVMWGPLEFPPSFGMRKTAEELYIESLDDKSGSSLKLTVLNPKGRVWLMVAGGGASVIYTDTVCDLGFAGELANYGEYSGNPTQEETYQYAKTVVDLMTRENDPKGKFLIIGGGIANFTDVAKTFSGIIQVLEEYKDRLLAGKIKIYVRRGGPNYKEGLARIRKAGEGLGLPIEVYGPETHMTKIVSMALGGAK